MLAIVGCALTDVIKMQMMLFVFWKLPVISGINALIFFGNPKLPTVISLVFIIYLYCPCVTLVFKFQFKVCPQSQCVSTPGHRTDLFQRDPGSVLITDFFGSVRKVEITKETINLDSPIEQPIER